MLPVWFRVEEFRKILLSAVIKKCKEYSGYLRTFLGPLCENVRLRRNKETQETPPSGFMISTVAIVRKFLSSFSREMIRDASINQIHIHVRFKQRKRPGISEKNLRREKKKFMKKIHVSTLANITKSSACGSKAEISGGFSGGINDFKTFISTSSFETRLPRDEWSINGRIARSRVDLTCQDYQQVRQISKGVRLTRILAVKSNVGKKLKVKRVRNNYPNRFGLAAKTKNKPNITLRAPWHSGGGNSFLVNLTYLRKNPAQPLSQCHVTHFKIVGQWRSLHALNVRGGVTSDAALEVHVEADFQRPCLSPSNISRLIDEVHEGQGQMHRADRQNNNLRHQYTLIQNYFPKALRSPDDSTDSCASSCGRSCVTKQGVFLQSQTNEDSLQAERNPTFLDVELNQSLSSYNLGHDEIWSEHENTNNNAKKGGYECGKSNLPENIVYLTPECCFCEPRKCLHQSSVSCTRRFFSGGSRSCQVCSKRRTEICDNETLDELEQEILSLVMEYSGDAARSAESLGLDYLPDSPEVSCVVPWLNCSVNNRDIMHQRIHSWKRARYEVHLKHRNLDSVSGDEVLPNFNPSLELNGASKSPSREPTVESPSAIKKELSRLLDNQTPDAAIKQRSKSHAYKDSQRGDNFGMCPKEIKSTAPEECKETPVRPTTNSLAQQSEDQMKNTCNNTWIPKWLLSTTGSAENSDGAETMPEINSEYELGDEVVDRQVDTLCRSYDRVCQELKCLNESVSSRLNTLENLVQNELYRAYRLIEHKGIRCTTEGSDGECGKITGARLRKDAIYLSMGQKKDRRVPSGTLGQSNKQSLPAVKLHDSSEDVGSTCKLTSRSKCKAFPTIKFEEFTPDFQKCSARNNSTALSLRNGSNSKAVAPTPQPKLSDAAQTDQINSGKPATEGEREHFFVHRLPDGTVAAKGIKRKLSDLSRPSSPPYKKMRVSNKEFNVFGGEQSGMNRDFWRFSHTRNCRRRSATDPTYSCIIHLPKAAPGGHSDTSPVRLLNDEDLRKFRGKSAGFPCGCRACRMKERARAKRVMFMMRHCATRGKERRKLSSPKISVRGKTVTPQHIRALLRKSRSRSTCVRMRRRTGTSKAAGATASRNARTSLRRPRWTTSRMSRRLRRDTRRRK